VTVSVTAIVAVPDAATRFAGTVAVMEVAVFVRIVSGVVTLLKVQFTTVAVVGKLVPVRLRVNALWPTTAEVGLRLVRLGLGLMVNVWFTVDVIPDPLETPTCAEPCVVSRLMGTWAVNWVELTKAVPRLAGELEQKLHHVTTEPLMKLVPVTVMVIVFGVPAVVLDGESDVTVGSVGAEMVNVEGEAAFTVVPPPVLVTPTVALPVVVSRLAGIVAVSCVALFTTVFKFVVEPVQGLVAHQVTTETPFKKFDPVTTSVVLPDPAVALVGEIEEIDGVGLEMVNVAFVVEFTCDPV
jgi:hypothetical protein